MGTANCGFKEVVFEPGPQPSTQTLITVPMAKRCISLQDVDVKYSCRSRHKNDAFLVYLVVQQVDQQIAGITGELTS